MVSNTDAIKPIEHTANTENAVEESYLLELYQKLDDEQQSGDEAAQLKAFQALHNYHISQ